MSCLDNIVSVRDFCAGEQTQSLSGLDLFDAPEISLQGLAKIAPAEYIGGLELAREKVRLATLLMKNDLMSMMAASNVIPNITQTEYSTGIFKTDKPIAADGKTRGVTLHKSSKVYGNLTKNTIKYVRLMPVEDHEAATLYIYDNIAGGMVTTFTVALQGGEINEFELNYQVQGTHADVYLENIAVYSNVLTCYVGCGGHMPNPCGYTKGYYNGKAISAKEGYGIQLVFYCKCDYDQLLCSLANTFLGELVWFKARILLLDERLKTDRLNEFVTYNREETQQTKVELINEYGLKWQTFVGSMPNILKNFKDSCLECKGARWVTNI